MPEEREQRWRGEGATEPEATVDSPETHAESLERLAWDYLDGQLPSAETVRFEHALARPEVAEMLSQVLILRDLLATMPPDEAPITLVQRLEAQLATPERRRRAPARFPRLRTVLSGMQWAYRGPALVLSGGTELTATSNQALAGLSTVVHTLGPLTPRVRQGPTLDRSQTATPWWRRLLPRRRPR